MNTYFAAAFIAVMALCFVYLFRPKDRSCANCRHCHLVEADGSKYQICRRYPPVPVSGNESVYPVTPLTNTCGEWR